MTNYLEKSIKEIHELLKNKKVTSKQLIEESIQKSKEEISEEEKEELIFKKFSAKFMKYNKNVKKLTILFDTIEYRVYNHTCKQDC